MAERNNEIFGIDRRKAVLTGVGALVLAVAAVAGIGEEIGPEGAALVSFPAGDSAALRQRLAAILALPAERRRALGLAARQAVADHWSWGVVAARLLA